jgi:hypothetical protein
MANVEHLTLGESIPNQTLKKDYVKVEDKPFGQTGLGYTMVVPNSWIQLKLSAKSGRLLVEQPKLLATYLGPKDDNGNPMLQVWCQGLVREIGAAEWLKDFLTKTGNTILSLEAHSPYLADALVGRVQGPVRLKIRFAAHLSGNRLFLIQGIAPEDLFEKYADNFGLAVSSFKPTATGDNPHVELWQTHHLDKAITFNAPISWLERRPKCPPGLDLVDLYNLNAEGEPVANLKVMSVRHKLTKGKKGLDLPALLIAEFTKAGVLVTEIAEDERFTAPKPLANGKSMICKAIIPKAEVKQPQNLLIVSVDASTHHVLTGLLTCAPNEGFYEYAVNRRAFDIVLETFKLPEV